MFRFACNGELEGMEATKHEVSLTDEDLCALEYAATVLRMIAERQHQTDGRIEPVNDIRTASARAKAAIRRLEPVMRKIDTMPSNAGVTDQPRKDD